MRRRKNNEDEGKGEKNNTNLPKKKNKRVGELLKTNDDLNL
jgi:hypothetical protein